ncbi:hypothetical protein GCM10029963_33010 [Micromonospora andamanensis]|nr:hypothetical protein Vwe01_53690 [Micromonospora andamanensis]
MARSATCAWDAETCPASHDLEPSGQCAWLIDMPHPGHHRCARLNNANPAAKPTSSAAHTAIPTRKPTVYLPDLIER